MQRSANQASVSRHPPERSGFASALRETRLLSLILVAISLIVFFLNIRHGIGILPDTTRYMGINDQPYDAPLYAWLFKVAAALGFDLTATATVAAIVLLCANAVLLVTLLYRLTGQITYAAAGAALVVFAPQFVTQHALAMSEPLFLMLLFVTMHLSLSYLETEKRRTLALSGLALGAASLARFTAPPLGAALATVYLLNPGRRLSRRVADTAILSAISGGVFFGWVLSSHLSGAQSIGRDLSFLGTMGLREWYISLTAMAAWMLPDDVPDVVRIPVLLLVLAGCAILVCRMVVDWRRSSLPEMSAADLMLVALSLFFVFYVAFVFLASAIEANLHLNGRYGFPAQVTLAIVATSLAARLLSKPGQPRALAMALTAFAAVIVAVHGTRTAVRTHDVYRAGLGFNGLTWKESPALAGVRKLPADSVIYSNGADAISYIIGRQAHFIPHERLLRTNLPDPVNPLPSQIAAMQKNAETRPVHVVYLDKVWWRPYLIVEGKLAKSAGLELIETQTDGRIYKIATLPKGALPATTPVQENAE